LALALEQGVGRRLLHRAAQQAHLATPAAARTTGPTLGLEARPRFRNILVLSDLTDTTDFAFAPVAALARQHKGARVVLAHAVIGSTEQFFLDDAIRTRIDKKAMDKARPQLEEVASRKRAAGVDVETALEIGSPFNVLFWFAERYGVDCIVVPTRHQHSLVRRVSNSVTARAIRAPTSSTCGRLVSALGAAYNRADERGFRRLRDDRPPTSTPRRRARRARGRVGRGDPDRSDAGGSCRRSAHRQARRSPGPRCPIRRPLRRFAR
jgi:nucleotide-binding universal stress UspA family protein